MRPHLVSYFGGPLHGTLRKSRDDQVPNVVCTSDWDRYEVSDRFYLRGSLFEVAYRYTGKA